MKQLIYILLSILLCSPFTSKAQLNQGNCPDNIDFELGDFSNWTALTGNATNPNGMVVGAPVNNRHTILSRATSTGVVDQYGGFPVLCPDGSGFSVKLGNNLTGNQAERLRYRFTVPNTGGQYSMILYYAVVFQNPNHTAAQQPKFEVKVYDAATGLDVGCAVYSFVATSSLPGFIPSSVNNTILYRDWTPLTIDLSQSVGKQVVVEFTSFDCTPGGHFGYSYVDVGTSCLSPLQGFTYCTNADTVKLNAPYGYQGYTWWNANYTQNYGSGQQLALAPPPPVGTVINLDVVPFAGYGCRDTLSISLVSENPPPVPIIDSLFTYCINQAAPVVSATVLPGYVQKWYSTPTGGTPLPGSPIISTAMAGSDFYWVAQQSFGGCEGPRKKVEFKIINKPSAQFTINSIIQCVGANNYVFTVVPPLNTSFNYNWNFGDNTGTASGSTVSYIYTASGMFPVQLITSQNQCIDTFTIPVQVITTPLASFTVNDICQNDTLNIVNNSFSGMGTIYTWDFGNGITSNLANPRVALSSLGNNNIKLTVTLGNCSDDTTIVVKVFERPKANFYTNTICTKDSVQFFDNSTVVTSLPIIDWRWDFVGGGVSTLQNPKIAVSTFGLNAVKLTVSNGFCAKDTTITVPINEKPIANILRLDTACLGQNFNVNDNSFFGSGSTANSIATRWWQLPNGTTVNTPNISTVCNALVNNLRFAVTASNGCNSDTINFIVNAKSPTLSKFTNLTPFCERRELSFIDQTPNVISRIWKVDGVNAGTEKIFTNNNYLPGFKTFSLVTVDSFGCNSLQKDTLVEIRKRPSFTFNNLDSCLEIPVRFVATDNDINNISEWQWTYEGTTRLANAANAYQFAKKGDNTVAVYGKDPFGCVSDTLEKIVKIYHNAVIAVPDKIAASLETVQLGATIDVPASFIWTPSLGLNNPLIQAPIATNTVGRIYTVMATSVYGCKSFDNVKIDIYQGPEVYIPTIFTPNGDGINDVLKITPIGITTIDYFQIYDRAGNLVFETKNNAISWNGKYKGKNATSGTFVYMLVATDYLGKKIVKKGTIVVAR